MVNVCDHAFDNVDVNTTNRRTVLGITAAEKDSVDVTVQLYGQGIGCMAAQLWVDWERIVESAKLLPAFHGGH
ncbi:MAG: hypothetical protein OEU68_08025 [Nitrospira sp.]|nr:hypothetical protein [Nitrospira sp.]MDH4356280.1 hypothetical protein [Nitrospira sp.]